MTVYESDLPGVGTKHEIELDDGSRLVVVTHNTGRREVFRRADADADSEKLFELTDELARQVGTVLEGAYFQPVRSSRMETVLGEDTVLEWVDIDADSALAGRTLADARVRQEYGASVVAIQRGDETVAAPAGDTRIEAGDTLVVIGDREACRSFAAAFGDGEPGGSRDSESDGDADSGRDADTDTASDADTDTDSDADTDSASDADTDTDSDGPAR